MLPVGRRSVYIQGDVVCIYTICIKVSLGHIHTRTYPNTHCVMLIPTTTTRHTVIVLCSYRPQLQHTQLLCYANTDHHYNTHSYWVMFIPTATTYIQPISSITQQLGMHDHLHTHTHNTRTNIHTHQTRTHTHTHTHTHKYTFMHTDTRAHTQTHMRTQHTPTHNTCAHTHLNI